MRKTELLIPAGSLDVLKTAVIYGADAVYITLSFSFIYLLLSDPGTNSHSIPYRDHSCFKFFHIF